MAEPQKRLKFKRFLVNEGPLIPQGYRLATVEEIRNNLGMFKKWELPVKRISSVTYEKYSDDIRLLDGWVPADFNVVHEGTNYKCGWNAVVKKKVWNSDKEKWLNCSDFYSSGGNSLREELYKGIELSEEGIDVAWLHAYCYEDVELLYWLWRTSSHSIAPDYFKTECRREDNFMDIHDRIPLRKMVRRLRSHGHGVKLQMENEMKDTEAVLRNAIDRSRDGTNFSYMYGPTWCVATVELAIHIYGQDFKNTATRIVFENAQNVPITTKFLSLLEPNELQEQIANVQFVEVLIEAAKRRYTKLVEKMATLGDNIAQITGDVYVQALTEAVAGGYTKLVDALLDGKDVSQLPGKVGDEEKSLFHYALPHKPAFSLLLSKYACSVDDIIKRQDKFGRNVLHWAAKGCYDTWVVDRLLERLRSKKDLIQSEDHQRRTPWHIAASKGDIGMIKKLRRHLRSFDTSTRLNYIQATDSFGQTALQMAASEGHEDSVRMLLDEGACPLKERDGQRKTALHHAAKVKNPKAALDTCKALLGHGSLGHLKRSLLLWASATGIGTADEMEDVHDDVKIYLQKEKRADGVHLLQAAAINNNVEIAWELLSRGAEIKDIQDLEWTNKLQSSEKESVKNVLSQMEHIKEQGRDQPSMEDKLGRYVFAQGLAALFLNRFIESPITVGISGEWGMGKSSLMFQTEKILLITAAQLTFPHLLPLEQFGGVQKISLSTRGRKIYQHIKKGVHKLLDLSKNESKEQNSLGRNLYQQIKKGVHKLLDLSKNESKEQNSLVTLLNEYQPRYHDVYKALACMDNNQMLQSSLPSRQQEQENAFRGVPRILTIQYNAWHYRNEHEAWAGLGVTISKEIEKAMTSAQWMSTCWRYTWAKQKVDIWIQIFLPSLLGILLVWTAWMLLKQAKFHSLKYGSTALTIISIVWVALKSISSIVKPVSTQMLSYVRVQDHISHLGYQEAVINDINFLKTELGKQPYPFFTFIVWCWNWFGLYGDNVENTSIPKCMPACGHDIRIVTFVDDIDRCEDKVILQVLSAINLVLTECKINVILGMDKKMIERAIGKNFKSPDDDLAEKFISKIIQIPLSLPDPTDQDSNSFLEYLLRHKIPAEYTEKKGVSQSQRNLVVPRESPQEINAAPMEVESNHVELDTYECDEENGLLQCAERSDQQRCRGRQPREADRQGCGGIIKVDQLKKLFHEVRERLNKLFHEQQDDENINLLRSAEGVRLIRELLLPNYTSKEADLFYKLKNSTTGNQKLPREWKCLLNYHKFAWYVLSLIGKVYSLPTWKEELVAWVFVCWQWKREMNHLIKVWNKILIEQDNERNRRLFLGPSLSELVAKCMFQLPNADPTPSEVKYPKRKKANPSGVNGQGIYQLNWSKLQEALTIQDVSMEGIQLFQQFRLHCEIDRLPWPQG